ncbi:diadenylate cyclase CdaM [[Mycoplasma] testudinis]|uniref:diadenylate cyclase CdaM n=1 Tax=[Mycoplasma] testudinis TaxID=33924 RepID=UPI000489B4A1|nr:diadenylate cyclase CdaM [[Mycoplasma] testudinis]
MLTLSDALLIAILVIILLCISGLIVFLFFKNQSRDAIMNFLRTTFRRNKNNSSNEDFYGNLSSSLLKLSADKIGAIIAIEREDSLETYINVGYKVKGDFSPEFIISVFYNKRSALHDGAVIVRNQNIVSISSYFPMTRQLLDVSYGARHRSAVGLSERTDSVIFVVSETNGRISVAQNGLIRRLSQNPDRLVDEIGKVLMQSTQDIK